MLVDRNVEPSCMYCRYGADIGYSEVACIRRGIMAGDGSCGSFRYEPTKRAPKAAQPPQLSGLSEDDFTV